METLGLLLLYLMGMKGELAMTAKKIFTRDEAMQIIDLFEDVLSEHNIKVPSPEDDEREPDNDAGLYGSTYSNLLDSVEYHLISLLTDHEPDVELVTFEFSGRV